MRRMKARFTRMLCSALLAMAVALPAFAISLEDAARQAAAQYDAKVLSARTVNRGGQRVHEIKLLTRDGVVKVVHVPEGEGK
jgi:hypothetical protein